VHETNIKTQCMYLTPLFPRTYRISTYWLLPRKMYDHDYSCNTKPVVEVDNIRGFVSINVARNNCTL